MAECIVAGRGGGGGPWVKIAEMSWTPSAAVTVFSGGITLGTITVPGGFDIQMIRVTGQLVHTDASEKYMSLTISMSGTIYYNSQCYLPSNATSVLNGARLGAPPNWAIERVMDIRFADPSAPPVRLGAGTRVVVSVFGIPNP